MRSINHVDNYEEEDQVNHDYTARDENHMQIR